MSKLKNIIIILLFLAIASLAYAQFTGLKNRPDLEEVFLGSQSNQTAEYEVISPFDHVKEEDIHVYDDRVVVDIRQPVWSKFTDTNSMDPVIDIRSNAVQIIPENKSQVHVGDIVSYESKFSDGVIIHRVIKIANDSKGWYVLVKGDNLPFKDPGRVRFGQIKKVTVGIIY